MSDLLIREAKIDDAIILAISIRTTLLIRRFLLNIKHRLKKSLQRG